MLPQDIFSQADNMTVSPDLHSLGKRKGEAEGKRAVAAGQRFFALDRVKKEYIALYRKQLKIKY